MSEDKSLIDIDNFVKRIRNISTDDSVLWSLHITSEGYEIECKTRSIESLKKDCISMRNLKGEFIK